MTTFPGRILARGVKIAVALSLALACVVAYGLAQAFGRPDPALLLTDYTAPVRCPSIVRMSTVIDMRRVLLGDIAAGGLPGMPAPPCGDAAPCPAAAAVECRHGLPAAVPGLVARVVESVVRQARGSGPEAVRDAQALGAIFLLCVPPVLAMSLFGGLLLAWREQARVAALGRAAGEIASGDLGQRFPLLGGRDLGRVCVLVNQMLDGVQTMVSDTRTVSDGMAHDIRAPLARARLRLEHTLLRAELHREAADLARATMVELDHALCIVSAVHRISEVGSAASFVRPFDVAEAFGQVVELYLPVAEAKSMSLDVRCPAGILVSADRDLLLEAMFNLVDNAIKYAPEGSSVTLFGGRIGTSIVLRVADQGPGIPIEDRRLVLRRFHRCLRDLALPGTGLGLSLVDAIVRRHGFGLEIKDGRPGCIVEVSCPAIPAVSLRLLPQACTMRGGARRH